MKKPNNPGVNLIVLKSHQQERLRNFYQTLLGVQFEQHTDHGPMHYGTWVGEVYLEIYPSKEVIKASDSIGFSVNSLEKTIEGVGKESIHRVVEDSKFGKRIMLKDPDGRLVHLTKTC